MHRRSAEVSFSRLELDGARYAVVRETVFLALCRRCGATPAEPWEEGREAVGGATLDAETLTQRLIERRRRAGLTQAGLARKAGIRIETLNRIERGRTTPDFATIRKLVEAMNAADAAEARKALRRTGATKGN